MKIIVGLGNPGTQYETTRHNVGWLALDRLVDSWRAAGPKTQNGAEVWQATRGGEKVLLVKPLTFMNLSGRAVAPLAQFYKCAPEDVVAIHDELDLAPATIRIKTGGGNGGHNGLKSLDEHLGSSAYHRIRLGIGHPRDFNPRMDVSDWVLAPFSQSECDALDPVLDRAREAAELLIIGEAKRAMNIYNASPKADASEGK